MPDQPDLVIAGGTVVTESWSGPVTVAIAGETVQALIDPSVDVAALGARTIIDASGRLVLPGGVDPHFHLAIPLGEFLTLDTFESGTLAALAGGTTTVIDFAIPARGQGPVEALDAKLAMGKDSRCDYAFHGCINMAPDDAPAMIDEFVARGVRTVKLFTTYRGELMVSTDTIESVMKALNGVSGLTYVHAEENDIIEAAQESAAQEGRINARGMAATRPALAEETAVARVLAAAERTGSPVYFVHQSIPNAVDLVDSARRRGVMAFSESCPHYLVLDDSCYLGRQPERFVCCPPIRDRETVDELGRRLAGGYIHSVGSDHCCYGAEQKLQCEHDVRIMPNGLPGVETRLTVTWNEYVARGLMSPENFVRVMSSNPARLNGLFPRKGTIAPGSDADLVIFDPNETRTVRVNDLHMASDYTPYEGREVTGWPTAVLMRGRVVFADGELIDPGPTGQYLSTGEITLW